MGETGAFGGESTPDGGMRMGKLRHGAAGCSGGGFWGWGFAPAHRAAPAPLPLAAEEEGAEVRGEAAVVEGEEEGLGEAERRRELAHQLPRAVEEEQENGGLGGGHTRRVTSPSEDRDVGTRGDIPQQGWGDTG